jgi:hypothetical protein
MTLGNMRDNGMRSLAIYCWQCHHQAMLSADPWPDDIPVPAFGPRMVCTSCALSVPITAELEGAAAAGERAMALTAERLRCDKGGEN